MKHFGPNVNLGNIPPDEVIPLETLRLGLRGDTLKELLVPADGTRDLGDGLEAVIAGLLIGLLVGMTGMGGGSLMTPMLILVFGFKPTVAIGTDILHGAIFKSFGAARHRQLGHVHARLAMWMLLGSAPASLVGRGAVVVAVRHLRRRVRERRPDRSSVSTLVIGGIGFFIKAFVRPHGNDAPFLLQRHDRVIAVLLGVFGGFIVGLTSVGSGTFFGLVMMIAFPLTAAKIVGTDLFQAALLLWVAGFGHFVTGSVDLHATGWLLIGSIPGVLLGSQLTVKLPDRALRVGLALVLSLSGVKLLDPPGANAIVLTVITIALVVGLSFAARWYLRRALPPVVTPERVSEPEPT